MDHDEDVSTTFENIKAMTADKNHIGRERFGLEKQKNQAKLPEHNHRQKQIAK